MTTSMSNSFVFNVMDNALTIEYAGRTLILRQTNAVSSWADLKQTAELEIVENEKVVAYVTPYGDSERGFIHANFFGKTMPVLKRTLEEGLQNLFG